MSTKPSTGRVRSTDAFIKTHRETYSVQTMCASRCGPKRPVVSIADQRVAAAGVVSPSRDSPPNSYARAGCGSKRTPTESGCCA